MKCTRYSEKPSCKGFYSGGEYLYEVYHKDDESIGFSQAQINVLFSVNDYTRESEGGASKATVALIDSLLDSLKWTDFKQAAPVPDQIPWGVLMSKLNFDERWVYSGSETQIPCR